MRFLSLIPFLFFLNASSQTGSIKGRITSDGRMLEFVSVGITGTAFSSTTNSKGQYIIKDIPYGKYEFVIVMPGYKTEKKNIEIVSADPEVIDQELFSLTGSLNEVVITGTMKEMSRLDSPIPVEVLTPKL